MSVPQKSHEANRSGKGGPPRANTSEQTTKRKRGHPRFEPTPEHRRSVPLLVGMGMKLHEVANLICWPGTDKPVGEDVFRKVFATEIMRGAANVKAQVIARWFAAVQRDEPWAIRFGLEHRCGFRDGGIMLSISDGTGAEDTGIQIEFIKPSRHYDVDGKVIEHHPGPAIDGK